MEIIKKYPYLQIFPYRWNFFHLIAKFFSNRILVISCIEFHVPLVIDSYHNTPIHYLLNKREIDYGLVNGVLEGYSEMISKQFNKFKVISSLTKDLPSILRLNTPQVATFLKVCIGKPQTYGNEDIPHFGWIKDGKNKKFLVSRYEIFTPEIRAELLDQENEERAESKPVVSIWLLRFYLNYKPHSKNMLRIIKSLNKVTNEEIYKSQAVSILIQYLWAQNKLFHYSLALTFTVLMLFLSVYSGIEEKILGLEIVIFILGVGFMCYEIFQLHFTPFKVYYMQIWNIVDVLFNIALIVTIFLPWVTDVSEAGRNWLYALSLFFGYLRWISFFRVVDQTRKNI